MAMDADDEFDFDELDSAVIRELDSIEARAPSPIAPPAKPINKRATRIAQIQRQLNQKSSGASNSDTRGSGASSSTPIILDGEEDPIEDFDPPTQFPLPPRPAAQRVHDSDPFSSDDFFMDEAALQEIDRAVEAAEARKANPSKMTRQTTLTGEILQPTTNSSRPKISRVFSRTKSSSSGFGKPPPRTKKWDHTALIESSVKGNLKGKGKGKVQSHNGEEEVEGEKIALELLIEKQPASMKVEYDQNTVQEWFYPLNHPKRDYQFNIVRNALFENTLVALPTGLGKTFIAGVVMLNYYRWFPKGKIVFLAPTKPLVAQQIEASHMTCGIPGSDAAELTGDLSPANRLCLWESKRVFYLTPQTFVNDLAEGRVNCRDIVLVVVDEAHRATGHYAYCTAVRYMMTKTSHFRILALTATPGSNAQAVQAIVDSMHISHIEIRDEMALDLRDYVHKKHMVQHVVEMSPAYLKIRDKMVKLMEKILQPVGHLLPGADMKTMNEFRPTAKMRELGANERWAFGPLSILSALARAMQYLMTESIEMCHDALQALSSGGTDPEGRKSNVKAKKLASEPLFREIIHDIENQKRVAGMMVHPKIEKLKMLLLDHFAADEEGSKAAIRSEDGPDAAALKKCSKVMVFASYRQAVEQIVEELNCERPIIRAHRFIGQAKSKEGGKGLSQKEQLQVIERFKNGEFNTLVCTSIGEEGLDIGEVDYIVCYDSHKAPIKMLQRVGRTGRKKDGHIAVLVAEGKEEDNFQKAKDAYADVQRAIVQGEQLELYGDVERLIPSDNKPQVCEKVMEIQPYAREDNPKVSKRMRNGQPKSVPAGGLEGFISAKQLVKRPKAPKKDKVIKAKDLKTLDDLEALIGSGNDDDDDNDLDIDAELSAMVKPPPAKKSRKETKAKKKPELSLAPVASPSKQVIPRQDRIGFVSGKALLAQGVVDIESDSDSDDARLELKLSSRSTRQRSGSSSSGHVNVSLSYRSPESNPLPSPKAPSLTKIPKTARVMSLSSSPPPSTQRVASKISIAKSKVYVPSPDWNLDNYPLSAASNSNWLLDSDSDDEKSSRRNQQRGGYHHSLSSEDVISVPSQSKALKSHKAISSAVTRPSKSAKPSALAERLDNNMGPPPLNIDTSIEFSPQASSFPVRRPQGRKPAAVTPARSRGNGSIVDIDTTIESPWTPLDSSLPVAGAGPQRRRKRIVVDSSPSAPLISSPDNPPPLSQRHNRRKTSPESDEDEEAPPRRRRKTSKDKRKPIWDEENAFVAMEAQHSGEEVSGGGSDSEGVEDEYDRDFIAVGGDTQIESDYDQSAVYRQGLLTQAPVSLAFRNKPVRVGAFGPNRPMGAPGTSRARPVLSSSPRASGSEPDDYEFGSFVVEDEDISFLSEG